MQHLAQRAWMSMWRRKPWQRIAGRVERPLPSDAYSAWVGVAGWAFSLDDVPVRVRVRVGGRVLRELTPVVPRPDLARWYPNLPVPSRCGFEDTIKRSELPDRRFLFLRFEAEAQKPNGGRPERRTLGVVPVRRQDVGKVRYTRAAYGKVWNRASRSLTDARISVCGTTDEQEYARSGAATAGDIVKEARVGSNDAVLEIGCGTGRVGAMLAPRCGRWIGADVSENMLRYARGALGHLPNVSFHRLNGVDLDGIPDASTDVVYCTGVFMHLDEWDRFRYVTEAYRVLRPGGRVYFDNFSLLGEEGWSLFQQMSRLDPLARPPNISKSSTPEELRTYAERAGFAEIRVRPAALWVSVFATKPS